MNRIILVLFSAMVLLSCGKKNILNPSANKAGVKRYQVKSKDTDPGIVQDRFANQVYISETATQRNQLLLFLGATNSVPDDYQVFPQVAAELGYHVINLSYNNAPSVQICAADASEECFERMREEVQTGRSTSNRIFVNEVHSVEHRLIKLLEYMHTLSPDEGWDQYLVNGEWNYENIVLAGHSQGSGQVAYIARKNEVARVLLFSGPNDYSEFFTAPASWSTGFFATEPVRFYVLSHVEDAIQPFEFQYAFWQNMGLAALGDTVEVGAEGVVGSPHLMYTRMRPEGNLFGLGKFHNSVVVDRYLSTKSGEAELRGVWEYMLQ